MNRALRSMLQATVDRALLLDPQAGAILAPLHGKRIGVEITDPIALKLTIEFFNERVLLTSLASNDVAQDQSNVAVRVRGSASSLLRLAGGRLAGGAQELPSSAQVSVQGDIALLQQVRTILSRLRLDFEEPLAKLLGDELAYPLSRAARKVAAASHRAVRELGDDVHEFLAQESQLLAGDDAVQDFGDEVDRLRDALARLDKRVSRVANKMDLSTQ